MKWQQIDDGKTADGVCPSVLTKTYKAGVVGGALYRAITLWPGSLVTESMAFAPEKDETWHINAGGYFVEGPAAKRDTSIDQENDLWITAAAKYHGIPRNELIRRVLTQARIEYGKDEGLRGKGPYTT